MDTLHPPMTKTTYAFKFPVLYPVIYDSGAPILHSAMSNIMSPDRLEMRNDALSRIGLPTIPLHPTSQVSEWNDDETTLVTSASLSMSIISSDTCKTRVLFLYLYLRLHSTDGSLLDIGYSDSEDLFQDRVVDEYFYVNLRAYSEELYEFSRTIRRFLYVVGEAESDDLSSELG